MDMPTKEEFAQGMKRARDHLRATDFDTVDGLTRKTWKKFKASLAGVNLNCATGNVVVIDSGPPCLGLPNNPIEVRHDPWREVIPYHQEHNSSSMETEPPTPIDPPDLIEDPPLRASLVEDVLTTEEMYNVMADADSTEGLGESDNPIVL